MSIPTITSSEVIRDYNRLIKINERLTVIWEYWSKALL
jgi:enolase